MAALPSRRVNAPVSRLSSTERWPKQCRPSITWMQPRRTSSLGESDCTSLALEDDRALGDLAALGAQQVGDRLQRRRLAGAIGAQQRGDATGRHRQRHALQHQDDVVVDHLDVVHREDGRALVAEGSGISRLCGRSALRRDGEVQRLDSLRGRSRRWLKRPLPRGRGDGTTSCTLRSSARARSPRRISSPRPRPAARSARSACSRSDNLTNFAPSHSQHPARRHGRHGWRRRSRTAPSCLPCRVRPSLARRA